MDLDSTVKVTDIVIALATLCGPIFAVQAQVWLDRRRESHRRRLRIFHALMAERLVNAAQIEALNAIPLEFSDLRDRRIEPIRTAWKVYINHTWKDASQPGWEKERLKFYIDLLQKMGSFLGYDFDPVELESQHYLPTGRVRAASDEETIRQQLARILRGEANLPLEVRGMPSDPEMLALWKATLTKLDHWLAEQTHNSQRG